MSKENFAGVRMKCQQLSGNRSLSVAQSWGEKDQLFVKTEESAFLSVAQVEELVRRMTVWLDERRAPAPELLWEEES